MSLRRAKTLPEFFMAATTKYYENKAYLWRPGFRTLVWTYKDLWNHAAFFSEILKRAGVEKSDKVLIIARNSPFWVASFWGIQLRGALAVPLPPESNQELVEEICAKTSAKAIFRGATTLFKQAAGYLTLEIEEIAKPQTSFSRNLEVPLSENDPAEITYASGITGSPKGVTLTHKNLLANLSTFIKAVPVNSSFKFISIVPLFNMFEQIAGMLAPLSVGSQISYPVSLNSNHLKRIFQDDKSNIMLAVPEFLQLLYLRVKEKTKAEKRLVSLEKLLSFSSYLPMQLRRKLFGRIHRSLGWKLHTIISGRAALAREVSDFWRKTGIYVIHGYGIIESSPALNVNQYRDKRTESVIAETANMPVESINDSQFYDFNPRPFSFFAGIIRAIFQPALLLPLVWIFAPLKKQGLEKIEKIEKPVLFFSNHPSIVDGAVIYAALPGKIRRRLAAVAAAGVIFNKRSLIWKLLKFLLEYIYLVLPPTGQEQIKNSAEHIARALDRGCSALVFPEGRVSVEGKFQEIKKEAALLAKEMAVPIIPVKIEGTRAVIDIAKRKKGEIFQFPKRSSVSVRFGQAFKINRDVSDKEALDEIKRIMTSL